MSFDVFDRTPPEGPFKILAVCTGNVCRSPIAEALLRAALHQDTQITVRSAGTQAIEGAPMTDESQRIAAQLGASKYIAHRGSQLSAEALEEADLILALARDHRKKAVELVPGASRYAFTLREFAALAEALMAESPAWPPLSDAGARMRYAVSSVAQMRGAVPPPSNPNDDDVIDPYQKSARVYEESAAQIVPAVNSTVQLLRHAATRR